MTGSLDPPAIAFADAVGTLERLLAATRPQWDDSARWAFDRQHAEPLLADARRTATELNQLAQELNAAARLLANSA
jgi:hypothetical protein